MNKFVVVGVYNCFLEVFRDGTWYQNGVKIASERGSFIAAPPAREYIPLLRKSSKTFDVVQSREILNVRVRPALSFRFFEIIAPDPLSYFIYIYRNKKLVPISKSLSISLLCNTIKKILTINIFILIPASIKREREKKYSLEFTRRETQRVME